MIQSGINRDIGLPAVVIDPREREGFTCACETDFADVDVRTLLSSDKKHEWLTSVNFKWVTSWLTDGFDDFRFPETYI